MEWAGATPTWIKIQEGYIRGEESQPQTRPSSPGFQCQKYKSPLLAVKNLQEQSRGKKLLNPQAVLLKEPTHGLTYSESLLLSSSTGVEA